MIKLIIEGHSHDCIISQKREIYPLTCNKSNFSRLLFFMGTDFYLISYCPLKESYNRYECYQDLIGRGYSDIIGLETIGISGANADKRSHLYFMSRQNIERFSGRENVFESNRIKDLYKKEKITQVCYCYETYGRLYGITAEIKYDEKFIDKEVITANYKQAIEDLKVDTDDYVISNLDYLLHSLEFLYKKNIVEFNNEEMKIKEIREKYIETYKELRRNYERAIDELNTDFVESNRIFQDGDVVKVRHSGDMYLITGADCSMYESYNNTFDDSKPRVWYYGTTILKSTNKLSTKKSFGHLIYNDSNLIKMDGFEIVDSKLKKTIKR